MGGTPSALAALTLAVLAVACAPPFAARTEGSAQQSPASEPTLALVDQVGGMTLAMASRGTIVFAGVGPRVIAWDTARTEADGAALFGRSDVLPRLVHDLALDGDRLYAAVGGLGVIVLDVRDYLHMKVVDQHDTHGDARGVAIDGGRLYVADRRDGMLILDASQPGLPQLGSWAATKRVHDVVPSGDHTFVAVDEIGIVALAVADPASITAIGTHDGNAYRLLAVGDTLWAAADNGGVEVLDVRDPGAMTVVGKPFLAHHGGGDFVAGMAADGDRVVVSGAERSVWDVVDPFAPRRLSVDGGDARDRYCDGCGDGLAIVGDLAVIGTAEEGGLETWSLADMAHPARVRSEIGIGDQPWPLLFQGPSGALFTLEHRVDLDADGGIFDHDRASMMNVQPSPFDDHDEETWRADILVEGSLEYSAGASPDGQLVIDDIAAEAAPRRVGAANDGLSSTAGSPDHHGQWNGMRLAKAGDRLVMSGGLHVWGCPTFAVLDVADPTRPQFLSVPSSMTGDPATEAVASPHANYRGLAITADGMIAVGVDNGWHCDSGSEGMGGIEAIDLADPTKPRVSDHIETDFEQLDVAIHDRYAFVAAGEGGLRVYDIADVDAVREVGVWDDGDETARNVVLDWPRVVVGIGKRIVVLDVHQPEEPRVVATAAAPGEVRALRLGQGRVWAMTLDAGLVGYA
ncbi:MAG: hypothetical protein ABI780_12125, partial [Ardenticatenales bacterium]